MGETDEATVLAIDPDSRLDRIVDILRESFGSVVSVPDVATALAESESTAVDAFLVLDAPATDEYDDVDGATRIRELDALAAETPIAAYVLREGHQPLVSLFEAGADDVCRVPPSHPELLTRKIAYVADAGGAFDDEQSQLRSLFEAYPQDVFIKDDLSRFVKHTGKADHMQGFEREWIENLTEFELFPEAFAEFLFEEEQQLLDEEQQLIDKVEHYLSPAGEDRWASTTKVPRYDEDGNVVGIVGSSLDVTAVKRQERQMAALHEASRDLTRAETAHEIAEVAVDIAADLGPLPRVQVAFTDGEELRPVAIETVEANNRGGPVPYESHEQWYARVTDAPGLYVLTPAAPAPDLTLDLTIERVEGVDPGLFVPLGEHGVIGFVTDGEGLDGFTIELAHVLAANVEAALDRVERKQRLDEATHQFREFALLGSHELRNRLQRAFGDLSRLQAETDSPHADSLEGTIEGIDRMVSQLVTLAQTGSVARATQSVSVATVATEVWSDIDTDDARLIIEDAPPVLADRDSLTELFAHLLRNAIEHIGDDVTVTVGELDDDTGFYVADDGPGIPPELIDSALTFEYDDAAKRSGYGLYIVSTIADAHDWSVDIRRQNGTRVEFRGIERPDR